MTDLEKIEKMTELDRDSYLRHHKLCFYCWEHPIDGFVNGWTPVCEQCYDDNHQ